MKMTLEQIKKLRKMNDLQLKKLKAKFENEGNQQMLALVEALDDKDKIDGIQRDIEDKLSSGDFNEAPVDHHNQPQKPNHKPTRRDIRERRKHEEWI